MAAQEISAEFPFESKFVEVHGSKIHYVEQGTGDPVLFLHGNPTSSYLWRNIIPYGAQFGRAIAMDLIGMGKSDKPDLEYGFFDHYKYVEGSIEQMGLQNITLVIHDWGSALGFDWANRHRAAVKGIAYMEAIVVPLTWDDWPEAARSVFQGFRSPAGEGMVLEKNIFVERVLPSAVLRELTAHATRLRTKVSIGASRNTTVLAPLGITVSLVKSFSPSAIGWSRPNGPTTFGPLRICIAPITLRSA